MPVLLSDLLRKAGVDSSTLLLADGEQFKNWETLNSVFDYLLEQRCDRTTTLIALGGGVVGDLTGLCGCCYQRGVPFIRSRRPFAQVDSPLVARPRSTTRAERT